MRVVVVLLCAVMAGCFSEAPSGLAVAGAGEGPAVVYDPTRQPEPEVPFPNDLATRFDPTSRTGRRLNLAEHSPLESEAKLRRQLNRLDGFSVVGAITVPFDAPLDLSSVTADSIKVYDVTPLSDEFGREVPLDLYAEAFPPYFEPRRVFPFEAFADLPDLLFGPDNEVDGERVFHYEVETNTLIVRPLLPLRPMTTYAVVLTDKLVGLNGEPVRSPFGFINHAAQTQALEPVPALVPGGLESIAFAWTFTTRSVTDDVMALRDGLNGEGPLAWLAELYKPGFASFKYTDVENDGDGSVEGLPADPRDHQYTLKPLAIPKLLGALALALPEFGKIDFSGVDYVVFGKVAAPDFRGDDGTIWVRGDQVDHKAAEVTFVISVPETTAEHKPPFPVILYNHGARTSRFELLLVCSAMAKGGIAMIGVDAAGHGPFGGDLPALIEREGADYAREVLAAVVGAVATSFLGEDYSYDGKVLREIFEDLKANGLFEALFVEGRATDLDGDGVLLSGDGYFLANPFELSSNAVQTMMDNLSVLRLLRSFGEVPNAIENPPTADEGLLLKSMMAGDFDADGVLDIGGPDNTYFAMGTSLGGFHTSLLLAVAPEIRTGVPIVSGGGFTDVLVRTDLADAVDAILAEPLGPAVVGCPVGETPTEAALTWNNWSLKCRNDTTIASGEASSGLPRVPLVPGGTVELTNERLLVEGGQAHLEDAVHTSDITDSGAFSVTVAADVGDPLVLVLRDEGGAQVHRVAFEALREGLGRIRNTPRLRRTIQLAQTAMDFGDPLAYARHLIRNPLGKAPKNVLHIADIGDTTVPFATMVAFDRAVGLLGLDDETAISVTQAFIDHDAFSGEKPFWDIDYLQKDVEGSVGDGIGPLPPIETQSGVSAVRYPATGDHEYIALPAPESEFDWSSYSRNQILRFLMTNGAEVRDDLCLEDGSCDFLPQPATE